MATDTAPLSPSGVANSMLQCCQCPALFVRPVDLQTHLMLHQRISAILPDSVDLRCYSVDQSAPVMVSAVPELNFSAVNPSVLSIQPPAAPPWIGPTVDQLSAWPGFSQQVEVSSTPTASGTSGTPGTSAGSVATFWLGDQRGSVSQPPALNLSTDHQWQTEERGERQRLAADAAPPPSDDSESAGVPQWSIGATSSTLSHPLSSVVTTAGGDLLYTDESLQSSSCSSPPPHTPSSSSTSLPPPAATQLLENSSATAFTSDHTDRHTESAVNTGVEQYQPYSYPLEALSHCLLSFASSSSPSVAASSSDSPSLPTTAALNHRCVCGRVFSSPAQLRHHTLTCDECGHRYRRQQRCRVCQQSFSSLNQLLLHTEQQHSRLTSADSLSGVFSCGVCGSCFSTAHERYCHIASHLATPLLSTPHPTPASAVESTEPVVELKAPGVLGGNQGRFGCDQCLAVFAHRSSLIRHRRRIHVPFPRPLRALRHCHTCDKCGRSFVSARRLRWHAEIHASRPKVCAQCGRRFLHQSWLTRHERSQHPPQPHPTVTTPESNSAVVKTSITTATVKSTNIINIGSSSSTPSTDTVPCTICLRLYTRSSLKRHVQMVHERLQPYQCTRCQRRFAAKCNLLAHQLSHLSQHERPFRCAVCSRGYATRRDLQRHEASAHQPARLACNVCGRLFSQRKSLAAHMLSHGAERQFQCVACGRQFARKAYLTAHMRVHSGERPYSCPVCERSFASRSNYNVHVRNHARRPPVTAEV